MDQQAAPPLLDEWPLLDWMQRSDIGRRDAGGPVRIDRNERPGCVLYGPFWRLWPGAYWLTIDAVASEPRAPAQVVFGVEVIADNRQQLAWRDFTAAELSAAPATIEFIVPPELSREHEPAAIFEFKMFHAANSDLALRAVTLRRLAAEEAAPRPSRWRLPASGDPQSLAATAADGSIAVPPHARPGQFLYPIQPPVALPSGRYRLDFRCRITKVRSARRPILNVAINVGDAARQSYFYPAELTAGHGDVEFDIPSEFGVEAGAPGIVTVQFLHFGNAELAVGDIEMARTVPRMSAPPAEVVVQLDDATKTERRLWPLPRRHLLAEPLPLNLPEGAVAANPEIRGVARPDAAKIRLIPTSDDGEFRLFVARAGSGNVAVRRIDVRRDRVSRRKNVLVIGNCHAALIHEGFRSVPALATRFDAKYQNVHLPPRFYEQAKRELAASELLVVQDISDWDDHPLREYAAARSEIVRFPCVRFASPWPFDHCNGMPDMAAFAMEAPNLTFPYLDGLLARLRKEIPDPEARLRAYETLQLESIPNYRRAHDFETRRLLALDKKFACNIGEFTLENFRSEQVFYTTDHPNGRVFALMMANIMRSLGVAGDIPDIPALDQLQTIQVPVHPLVAEALGLEWAMPYRTYQFRQEQLTWEQYIRRYIACYG